MLCGENASKPTVSTDSDIVDRPEVRLGEEWLDETLHVDLKV